MTRDRRWKPSAFLVVSSVIVFSGCAKVSVSPLSPDGSKATQEEGLRYYLPKPYLMVMTIPAASKAANNQGTAAVRDRTGKIITPAKPGAAAKDTTTTPQPSSAAAAPTAGNTSFQVANDQYVAKLIYLPDYKHPMAVSENGWIGTASMNASLTDGWQLTSLQGSSDAKVAETITAIASLVSAASGAAGGGAGAAAKNAVKPGGSPNPSGQNVLAPGLYGFNFSTAGALLNLCVVTSFDPSNVSTLPSCPENAPTPPLTTGQ
jgi:hypothetical protein